MPLCSDWRALSRRKGGRPSQAASHSQLGLSRFAPATAAGQAMGRQQKETCSGIPCTARTRRLGVRILLMT